MSHFTALENDLTLMLMDAAKRTAAAVEKPLAADFDWDRPCCFEPHQMKLIEQLGDQALQRLAQALKRQLRIELNSVKVGLLYGKNISITPAAAAGESPYCMSLSDGTSAACGYLALPAAQAVDLVDKFLGGTGQAATTGREMSSVETALLLDIAAAVVHEFSGALVLAGGKALKQAGQLVRNQPEGFENTEFCRFAFGFNASADAPILYLAIPCAVLEPIVSPRDRQAERPSGQECVKRLQTHLGMITVAASVWIGQAELTMKDVLALEAGDVLAFSTNAGQPVDLLVQGQPVAHGVLATRRDKYALRISGR